MARSCSLRYKKETVGGTFLKSRTANPEKTFRFDQQSLMNEILMYRCYPTLGARTALQAVVLSTRASAQES